MHLYDIIAVFLTGLTHVLLYIQLIRYQRFSYYMITIVSIIFMILLATVVTSTGYPEFNIVMLLVFLLSLGLMKKGLAFRENLYFTLISIVGLTYTKTVLFVIGTEVFMLSPFNLYMWTGSLIHLIVASLLLISVLIWRKSLEKFALYIVDSKLYYFSYIILIVSLLLGFIINSPTTKFLVTINQQLGETAYFAVLILFFIMLLVLLIGTHLAKERLLEEQQSELDQEMLLYVEKLETAHDELASFRHDYINILASLEEGIRSKNITEIEHVYKDVIEPTARVINHHELDIIKLSRVLIPEVKSVLSVKITTAHQHKIKVMIDIPEEIESIPMSMVDFIRIISILLDNAIEESVLSHEKTLHVALFELDQCLYFIVRNSSKETVINLQEIFDKNYSSKNDGRGYGLFSLKRLVEKQENISLETSFTAPYFTQTLIMKRL